MEIKQWSLIKHLVVFDIVCNKIGIVTRINSFLPKYAENYTETIYVRDDATTIAGTLSVLFSILNHLPVAFFIKENFCVKLDFYL